MLSSLLCDCSSVVLNNNNVVVSLAFIFTWRPSICMLFSAKSVFLFVISSLMSLSYVSMFTVLMQTHGLMSLSVFMCTYGSSPKMSVGSLFFNAFFLKCFADFRFFIIF